MYVLFRASVSEVQYTTPISKRRKKLQKIPEKNILARFLLVSKIQVVEKKNQEFLEKTPKKSFFS